MATQENEATAKAATVSQSNVSTLRANAPQIRTAEAIIEKHEQIFDGLEHGLIENKKAEQLNQALKGILAVERLGLQYISQMMKFGRKVPVPRTPILRNLLGLPGKLSPTDGEAIRSLMPDGGTHKMLK